jgi:hypothetical protein
LVVSVLAVGLWPAERVLAALPQLRSAGVLDPEGVAAMDLGPLTVKLNSNGYARGLLTSVYAQRLQALMREVATGQLDDLSDLVRVGDEAGFSVRLRQIYGVGPKVAARAWSLLGGLQ